MVRLNRRQLWTAYYQGGCANQRTPHPTAVGVKTPYAGVVLGIDPSLRGTGVVVAAFQPQLTMPQLLHHATLKHPSSHDYVACLGDLLEAIENLMSRYPIDEAALEQTIYVQNRQVAQKMGAARGAIIAPLARKGIPVWEYAPLRVKQAVVGTGKASKGQVAKTVQRWLGLAEALPYDESDALAVALCHAWSRERPHLAG